MATIRAHTGRGRMTTSSTAACAAACRRPDRLSTAAPQRWAS